MILSKRDNRYISILFFSAILIFIHIGPVSVAFPFGAIVLWHFYWKIGGFKLMSPPLIWLFVLFLVGVVSSILSEVKFNGGVLYLLVQFLYWLLLTSTIGQLYPYIDKAMLSKTIAYGSVILGVANLAFGAATQNSVAFAIVIIAPLGVLAFKKTSSKLLYTTILLFIMFFNESRTGMFVLFVESLFIFSRILKIKNIKIAVIAATIIVAAVISVPGIRNAIGDTISPYNEDVALLLTDRETVLSTDKSWLQRRVQIEKGLQIFENHPWIGIGPGNFSRIDMAIDYSNLDMDLEMINSLDKTSAHRSTHNTYITLLSEFGLLGTLAYLLFVLTYFIKAYKNYKRMDEFEIVVLISAIGMSVYFYTIASLYGTLAWLFFGLLYGFILSPKRKEI